MSSGPRLSATAYAPASVANVAVGFDILGFAIEGIGDRVRVVRTPLAGKVEIDAINGTGPVAPKVPLEPEKNTATAGLVRLLKDTCAPFGFKVSITKGIPLGSGMGGSAASAVAAAVAANALLPKPLADLDLMRYALIGEAVASGSIHGDNVAPSLLGGLVLVTSVEPPQVVRLPVPRGLYAVVVHPPLEVETRTARAILRSEIPLKMHIQQSAKLAGFISGVFRSDLAMIRDHLADLVIEPQRATLIRGFQGVKSAALKAGALGCSISGAGPAVFALVAEERVRSVSNAMVRAFEVVGVPGARAFESILSAPGARVEGE